MDPGAIYVRVRTASGSVLFTIARPNVRSIFLPLAVNAPTFWKRLIAPGKPFALPAANRSSVMERSCS